MEEVDRARRKRIVRAMNAGQALPDPEDVQLALDLIESGERFHQSVRGRWWVHSALIGLGTGGLILLGIDPSFELLYLAVFGLFALVALILRPSMKATRARLGTAKAPNEDVVAAFRRRDDW